MRYALLLCLFCGCQAPPEATRDYVTLQCQVVAVEATNKTPSPTPTGICDNCNGTGKVGDGTVSVECSKCDGTGRLTPSPDGAFGSDVTCDRDSCVHPKCDGNCSAQCLCGQPGIPQTEKPPTGPPITRVGNRPNTGARIPQTRPHSPPQTAPKAEPRQPSPVSGKALGRAAPTGSNRPANVGAS